jgi:multiple sugar transport system permease protein/putative aldouronate transport system permease protein
LIPPITATGTAINVSCTLLAAYPLSRRDFQARGAFMFMVTFTLLFSGGMIPDYLLVKDLGMLGSRWALIIPGAVSAYNVIITRTFFQSTIPTDLLEAAQIDTCGDARFFLRIALPLSAPIIGVIALFYAVGHWNSWFSAMIYLNDPQKYPLQLVLRDILILNQMDSEMVGTDVQQMAEKQNLRYLLRYAVIVVASAPVMAIYPFVQRYFVRGVMIGSLKG